MSGNDYWETAYENGEYKHWEYSYPSPELVALVAAGVPRRNARVLDVGCGGGTDAIFMAQCGYRVTGVDISSAALKIAQKRAKKSRVEVDWRKGNVFELQIENGSIDFVTDRGLFHLIEDDDRPRYAMELLRVLKPRGDKYFLSAKFTRGPVLPIQLFSVVGSMDARIVMLRKKDLPNPARLE